MQTEFEKKAVAALRSIALVAGNLPDDRLTTRTGANDAVGRGLMVVSARAMARQCLKDGGFVEESDGSGNFILTPVAPAQVTDTGDPDKTQVYEYMGQKVQITRSWPYESHQKDGSILMKYQVDIMSAFGACQRVDFEELSLLSPSSKPKKI